MSQHFTSNSLTTTLFILFIFQIKLSKVKFNHAILDVKFVQHKKWVVIIKIQELAGQNCAKKTLVVGWRWVRFILCLAIPEVLKEREREVRQRECFCCYLQNYCLSKKITNFFAPKGDRLKQWFTTTAPGTKSAPPPKKKYKILEIKIWIIPQNL